MKFDHKPVMKDECIDALAIKPDGVYMDGTAGGAGHGAEIAKRLTVGKLIAVDKDSDALAVSAERLMPWREKTIFVHDDFKAAPDFLKGLGINGLDGILLDLGVSSHQIDSAERGFSYMQDAALDMRMDREQYLTAFNVVNEYSELDLTRILKDYGEERFAKKIAAWIVKERSVNAIRTTSQLVALIEKSVPKAKKGEGHVAKRTFQALRIEVNGELDNLKENVMNLARELKSGGRMAVITFHSLEDRAVKLAFRELELDCVCPPRQPICTCDKRQEVRILTKKPITPGEKELKENRRSHSAKLRVIEKI